MDGLDGDADQTYIRHMTTHHAQGIEFARIAAEGAQVCGSSPC